MNQSNMDITFHYPPGLLNLLIDVIPLLNRSKQDVFLFFQGAGISGALMHTPYQQWKTNKEGITKYEITRFVLTKLNEKGEACLRERREVLKRVVEFDNFSVCWETDRLKAKGLLSDIRDVVNIKDSFTRMNLERERERREKTQNDQARKEALLHKQKLVEDIKKDLYQLFTEINHQKRGKDLEGVMNRLFKAYDISIREAFTLAGRAGEGVLEQIDGVVEIDGHIYFVEMKWWESPLGVPEVSQHLVRVYQRAEGRAIIISASDFTGPAVDTCKQALQQKVVVLCTLKEIVMLLENQHDLKEMLKKKVNAAIVDRNPFMC
jgi:restriction system protein